MCIRDRGGGARILGGGATAAAPTSAPVGDYDSPSDAHSDSGDLKEEAPSQVSEKDLAQIAEQERQLLAKSEQDRQKAARRAEKSMDDARKRAIRLGFVDEEDEDEIIEPIDLVPSLPSASLGQDAYDWRSAGLPEAIPRRRS